MEMEPGHNSRKEVELADVVCMSSSSLGYVVILVFVTSSP